jgi:glycosyltransferase involved in cell wall biosynthesis
MISIAMATYNGQEYIREQVNSILCQTYQNFELIICDDCSFDSTWSILKEYEKKDIRIHCYLNEINLGFVKNFEKAIKLCSCEYIALSDQDDIWTVNHLETLLNLIGDNQVCCGNSMLMSKHGKILKETYADSLGGGSQCIRTDFMKLQRILYGENFFTGMAMLLNKSFLQLALPFPDNIHIHDIWLALLSCANHSFMFTEEIVSYYRQHDNNASGSKIMKLNKLLNILIKRILLSKKEKLYFYKIQRLNYCYELLKRLPHIDSQMKLIIIEAIEYFENRVNLFYRLKKLNIWIEHYKYMNIGYSKYFFLFRLIIYIFLG